LQFTLTETPKGVYVHLFYFFWTRSSIFLIFKSADLVGERDAHSAFENVDVKVFQHRSNRLIWKSRILDTWYKDSRIDGHRPLLGFSVKVNLNAEIDRFGVFKVPLNVDVKVFQNTPN